MPKSRQPRQIDPQKAERFAAGEPATGTAGAQRRDEPAKHTDVELPWRGSGIRTDVERNVLAPLPEDYRVALRWLAEQGRIRSQRQLAARALEAEIDRLVEQATGEPVRSSG